MSGSFIRGICDAEAKRRFCLHYEEFGMFYQAAAAANVCGNTINTNLKKDPEFAAAFAEAKGRFRDKIETEIHRRAMEGVDEYVTCGKGLVYIESTTEFEDIVTATGVVRRPKMVPLKQKRFSDSLLMFHAKRHIEEYREKSTIDHNIQTGGVLLVPAGASMEEWERRNSPINVTPEKAALEGPK